MEQFLSQFLGTNDFIAFFVSFSWAVLGFIGSLAFGVIRRNKASISTPEEFSWSFFFKDNILRFLAVILFLFIGVVFYQETKGEAITSYKALAFGLGIDQFVASLKNINKKSRS